MIQVSPFMARPSTKLLRVGCFLRQRQRTKWSTHIFLRFSFMFQQTLEFAQKCAPKPIQKRRNIWVDPLYDIDGKHVPITKAFEFLEQIFSFCISKRSRCQCSLEDAPRILIDYDREKNDKPAPGDGDYTLSRRNYEDGNLAARNLDRITGGDIHVLVTRSRIHLNGTPCLAVTLQDYWTTEGILYDIDRALVNTLAHELGHVARYAGDAPADPLHSKDSSNIMHVPAGSLPDCQWCKKVFALGK